MKEKYWKRFYKTEIIKDKDLYIDDIIVDSKCEKEVKSSILMLSYLSGSNTNNNLSNNNYSISRIGSFGAVIPSLQLYNCIIHLTYIKLDNFNNFNVVISLPKCVFSDILNFLKI